MFSQLVALSVLLSSARATTTSLTTLTVDAVFSGAGVTPAVIPSFTSTSLLDIAFNGYTVSPGQYLSIDQATPNPQFWATTNVSTWGENQFTIAIVDPDSAAPQTLHYLATGLTLNASGPVNFAPFTNSTPAIFDYIPPNPSAGNPHRYIAMLFVQPSGFWRNEAEYVPAPSSRTDFNITAFSQNLGLGNPVAGSLWYTGATLLEASATVDSAPASSAAPAATNSTVAATSSSAAPSSVAAPTSTAATTSAAASSSATPLMATVVSTKPSQTLTPSPVPSKVRSSAVGSAASRGVGRAVAALAMLASGFVFAV